MSIPVPRRAAAGCAALLLCACEDSSRTTTVGPNLPRTASRDHRAIAGISMGAYGALNLGTKRDDLFSVIAALGGPVDMQQLLRDIVRDNLEVAAQTQIPTTVGADFTFDHLPPYPDRGTRITMAKDLFLAFGNPVLHHPEPAASFLAVQSEPAVTQQDDRFGAFSLPVGTRGFLDGGDANGNGVREITEAPTEPTDVLLVARGTATMLSGGMAGTVVGDRELVDLDGNGVYDVGDGIVVNYSEPFDDPNDNLVFEPGLGETFQDLGLDGVAATGDFGEGNMQFDYDPDRAHWLEEDPLTRLAGWPAARIRGLRLYMDVGDADLLGFGRHYDNLVALLAAKGVAVTEQNGFTGSCTSPQSFPEDHVLVRYQGGHIGIPDFDELDEQLLNGDFCQSLVVWQRLLALIGFLESSFADGDYGLGGPRPFGETVTEDVECPTLTRPGEPTVTCRVLVYRPPAFFNTERRFPIVYFLGGYGQDPDDYERMGLLLDLLIASDEIQNMYFAFLPGGGGFQGSFYVDHVVPHVQAPGLPPSTGRYQTAILEDLIPAVEDRILGGRIRR